MLNPSCLTFAGSPATVPGQTLVGEGAVIVCGGCQHTCHQRGCEVCRQEVRLRLLERSVRTGAPLPPPIEDWDWFPAAQQVQSGAL